MHNEEEKTQVSVPTSLFKRLSAKIEGTRFESVSDYVTYVLESVLHESDVSHSAESFSKDDEARVKDRLRALGYI